MKKQWLVAVLAQFLWAACGTPPGAGQDSGAGGATGGGAGGGTGGSTLPPLTVTTQTLGAATVGQNYTQTTAATGGKAPYIWGVSSPTPELAWLRIDSSTGQLSGLPDKALVGGGRVTLAVTDQLATTATKDLALVVLGCTEGAIVDCASADGGVCTLGKQQCTGGMLPAGCPGTLSTDPSRCGPTCGACGTKADSCTNGACTCGSSPACTGGAACCGGTCAALDSVSHCGACGNDCLAQAGPNVAAVCSSGQCAFMCKANFQNCTTNPTSAGCGSYKLTDAKNCGACGNDCTPPGSDAGASWIGCDAGTCQVVCQARARDCDGDYRNGCEQPIDVNHCSACNAAACPAAGSNNVSTTNCVAVTGGFACSIVCMSGFTNCDGVLSNGCEKNTAADTSNCGTCGFACDLSRTDRCTNGTCMCGTSTRCAIGQRCLNGACVCDSISCTGCCSGTTCYPGTGNAFCGYGAQTCIKCGLGTFCTACTPADCGSTGGWCQ